MFSLSSNSVLDAAIILSAAALTALMLAPGAARPAKRKSALFIPGYAIIYSDDRSSGKPAFLMRSKKHGLTGKPDYLLKRAFGRAIIPVELKSGSIGGASAPRRGDLLQLGAYFILVREEYGVRPRLGRLVYADFMFVVPNSRALRRDVLKTASAMRRALAAGKEPYSQSDFVKCRRCMCRGTFCDG
jgi:CRISPR-associated exonuclease Cas4